MAGEAAWRTWVETVGRRSPELIRSQVAASGLRGRGGAAGLRGRGGAAGVARAFPWRPSGRRRAALRTRLIANGDEGDPGSYADRLLMEVDPARVLEGLALACFACGARRGLVLVRSEYPRAPAALRQAVEEARADGHLGRRVHGARWIWRWRWWRAPARTWRGRRRR
ncbi:hypothetical protein [Nonomuraea jabiensis]|uniref:NADH:ubiquinone oxidoreductase subunit F (NADH-binding) n=1 Tax=Nonomuraea jabiensis TaxID=882448 RepID=A0A7W9GF18_9ACTN|nr:hypothetical protein [Nonomuraea jabiensis]MBB5782604.1 NADH:ubiquinone oxidoreductase subunit F (NADH-binding) [Nonomuraea jabiensis]